MAKETKEERRLRIQKEVAEESAARREAYFKAQEESKAKAAAAAAPLPQPDAYVYDYAWRQGVGTPEGELKLIKSPNPYYDASTNEIVDPVTGARKPATQSMVSGASTSSDSLYDAKRAAGYGMDTQGNQYRGAGTTGNPLTYNGSPFTGTYNRAKYINGVLQVDSNNNQGGITSGTGTESDPLIVNGKSFSGVLGGVQYINGVAQTKVASTDTLTAKAIEDKARRTAQQDFKAALGELGLGDLADEVDRMIRLDYTVSQIKMELPKTASYQQRFPGIETLRKAGRAISEATYISNERGYLQTLRAYGLDTAILGSRTALGNYIQNEVSPREFEERVNLAATRVRENPDVMATFKTYYPEVDEGGVISYMLNPKAGLDIIKKQVRTSEIGAAATNAGFAQSLMTAAEAANLVPAVGEAAFAQIALEFKRARQLANTQSRLAQIEGQSYSDLEAIGAVVGDDVTKVLASERRAAREVARYSERGGITGASLRNITAI